MRTPTILTILFFLYIISCKGQTENGMIYNTQFSIDNIRELSNFSVLNKIEKSLDSMYSEFDQSIDSFVQKDTFPIFIKKRNFINNRSRILLTQSSNGVEKIIDQDKIPIDGFSSLCECSIFQDTIFINSGIGFFGGVGVMIKVYKNQFKSAFYEYIDDVKPYKLTEQSEFTDNILVESKYQYLVFEEIPNFKVGQQLTGYLTLTSNNYFSNGYGEKLDTNFVKVKMKFTCLTKQSNGYE